MSLQMGYRVKALEDRIAELEQGANFQALRRLKDLEKQYFDLTKLVNEHQRLLSMAMNLAERMEKRS